MALPREERMTPTDLLKFTRDTYDRLQEISPLLPTEVLREFKHKFEKEKDISKPEEANGLEHITVFEDKGFTLPTPREPVLPEQLTST
jgi:hypothetical protein